MTMYRNRLEFLGTLLLVTTAFAVNDTQLCNRDCPLWTTLNNETCKCECGSDLHGIVTCENNTGASKLVNCYCMTTNSDKNYSSPLVGMCYYTCALSHHPSYNLLTNNTENLNDKTCGRFKRTGLLCSKCIEGYGLPGYSFSLSCVECKDYKYNWLKYIAVAYIPLTVFYFIVIIFRISATSGVFIGFVTISQMFTIKGYATWLLSMVKVSLPSAWAQSIIKTIITLISIWNLDFFRPFYPPFCIHPEFSVLHLILLDYPVALYPLVLVLITYILVKLHDRFEHVLFCKPLYICLHRFRKEWDIRTSLIGAFSTFYLLSYVKTLNVTADILSPVLLRNREGKQEMLSFFYEPSLSYFSKEHRPYVIFAEIFFILFNICPLVLLCLYPCGCFQRCLNRTGCRWHTLHAFMDVILGSYTHKPRERRHFGALYLVLRLAHVAAFGTLTPFTYLIAASYIMITVIILLLIFRPYKNKRHSTLDIVLFSASLNWYLMVILFQVNIIFDLSFAAFTKNIYVIGIAMSFSILPLYGIVVLSGKILPWKLIKRLMQTVFTNICCKNKETVLHDSLSYWSNHEEDALFNSRHCS